MGNQAIYTKSQCKCYTLRKLLCCVKHAHRPLQQLADDTSGSQDTCFFFFECRRNQTSTTPTFCEREAYVYPPSANADKKRDQSRPIPREREQGRPILRRRGKTSCDPPSVQFWELRPRDLVPSQCVHDENRTGHFARAGLRGFHDGDGAGIGGKTAKAHGPHLRKMIRLVHKPIAMKDAMKIQEAEAAADREWGKFGRPPAWDFKTVKPK